MNKENLLFLVLSVVLSTGRNITSKKTAKTNDKKAGFFFVKPLFLVQEHLYFFCMF